MRIAICLAVSGLAVVLSADVAWGGCIEAGITTCPLPRTSRIVVNARFDNGDGVLDADEIQCAVDCIDNDIDSESAITSTRIDGGEITFDPRLLYRIDRPILLPFWVPDSLVIRGNGAILHVVQTTATPAGRFAALQRVVPRTVCNRQVETASSGGANWLIENLIFELDVPEATRRSDVIFKGLEIHGSQQLTVRGCVFRPAFLHDQLIREGFDVGVELRFALHPMIQGCTFQWSRLHDIALLSAENCLDGIGGSCWLVGPPCDWLLASGSNGALLKDNTLHEYSPTADAIVVVNSDNVRIDGLLADGQRPLHLVHWHSWIKLNLYVGSTVTNFFTGNGTQALILNDSVGHLVIDGFDLQGASSELFLENRAGESRVTLRSVMGLTSEVQFKSTAFSVNRYVEFIGCSPGDHSSPLRWIGGDVPLGIQQLGSERVTIPRSFEYYGQLLDPRQIVARRGADGGEQLWFCCGPVGELLRVRTCPLASPDATVCE